MRALALALALAVVTGCGGYSQNHRRGLLALGGAAVITGSVVAVDGAYCDESANGHVGCENDQGDVTVGVSLVVAGILLGGIAYLIEPQDETPPATTAAKPAAEPPVRAPALSSEPTGR